MIHNVIAFSIKLHYSLHTLTHCLSFTTIMIIFSYKNNVIYIPEMMIIQYEIMVIQRLLFKLFISIFICFGIIINHSQVKMEIFFRTLTHVELLCVDFSSFLLFFIISLLFFSFWYKRM